jgi:phosphate:Na+ symporter
VSIELDQFALWTGLLGGLALFLYGMDVMTVALKRAAGDQLKDLLGRMTSNRFVGVGVGALVTGIVNSSSVTTVILVGFISAGLMSMAQSVAVIMGANIGSTVTAQILAFNVTRFALPIVTLGFLVAFVPKGETTRDYGRMLLGAGLVFYGMGLMSGAMAPLRDYPPFIDFIGNLAHPIAGALAGMAFTAIIQSSAATTGIVIVLAGQGVMTLETAIAVALGANVGTCVTAGLAVIGKPREAVRAAVVHVLFNVAGVAIWIGFIPQLAELARAVTPAVDDVPGSLRAVAEAPRQVANAHTIFNVVNTLLLIGFTTQIARLVEWLVPDRPLDADEPLTPKFIDDNLMSTPAMALGSARREIGRMGDYVGDMLERVLPAALSGSRPALYEIEAMDKPVDRLHRTLIAYLGRISATKLSDEHAQELMQFVAVANDLEHIADRIATDMTTSARKRIDARITVQPEAASRIKAYHQEVVRALRGAVTAFQNDDHELAAAVRNMKHGVTDMAGQISRERFGRVPGGAETSIRGYVREIELVEILDGVFKIARRIARTELAAQPEQAPT